MKSERKNSITAQIRQLLKENPNARPSDLRERFDKVTPYILQKFYVEHKLLSGNGFRKNIRERVLEYYENNPGKTNRDASIALGLTMKQIKDAINDLRNKGAHIHNEKSPRPKRLNTTRQKIYEYMLAHPNSTAKECFKSLKVTHLNMVYPVLQDMRRKGLIPGNKKGYTKTEAAKAVGIRKTSLYAYRKIIRPAPVIVVSTVDDSFEDMGVIAV